MRSVITNRPAGDSTDTDADTDPCCWL